MKRIISTLAIVLAMSAAFSCHKAEEQVSYVPDTSNQVPDLQGIEVTPKTNYLVIGDTLHLSVSVAPTLAKQGSLVWSSEADSIATVSSEGVVKAVATGVVRINAEIAGKKSSALVNVVGERIPATSLVLSKEEVNILAGRSSKVKATLLPENTTDRYTVEWSSADESIATVSYGVIIGVAQGTTTVTATAGDLSASCKVIVGDKLKLVDRTADWNIIPVAYWYRRYGSIYASHYGKLTECDNELHYFKLISYDEENKPDIESIADDIYNQVCDKQDAGEDPSSLFSSAVPDSVSVSETGDYWAIALGHDAEYNFTGEYALCKITVTDPDPVHATGITFTEGDITEITLNVGKSKQLTASIIPEDCTDELVYTWTSADESIATASLLYTWSSAYSNYGKITAVSPGTTTITVSVNENVKKEIKVIVEASDIELVNVTKSAGWTYTYGQEDSWGWTQSYFQLETCTDAQHAILMGSKDNWSYTSDYSNAQQAFAFVDDQISSGGWYVSLSGDLPDKKTSWDNGNVFIVYVFGYDSDGKATGRYTYYEIDVTKVPTSLVSLDGQYFPVTWNDSHATLSNVTMSAWVNASSFSGGKDNIYTIMGTEGIFLLRFEGSNLYLVYGGDKRSNGEYNEKKISGGSFSTDTWIHVAATYSNGGDVILYVNGSQVGTGTASAHDIELNGIGASWVLPFTFYVGVSSNNRVWKGCLYDVAVYNKVLSADEIAAAQTDPASYSPIALWKFNEGSGDTIADASGNGYSLKASSSLTWKDQLLPY